MSDPTRPPNEGGLTSRAFVGSSGISATLLTMATAVFTESVWAGVALCAMATLSWIGFCVVNCFEKLARSKNFEVQARRGADDE